MTNLTRDQAREHVARAIHAKQCGDRCEWTGATDPWEPGRLRLADAALSVLWPEIERLTAELDHAHTVIRRHVEPKRCRPEAGDCCDGSAHEWQPSAASMLPDCVPAAAPVDDQGSGRVETRGQENLG